MSRKLKRVKAEETRQEFKEFSSLFEKLHEMLRSLGEEQMKNNTIKLDEFEKLRMEFVRLSEFYEKTSHKLKFSADPVERSKMLFELSDSKQEMEKMLKAMTTITVKLNQKINKEKNTKFLSPQEKKKKEKKNQKLFDVDKQEQILLKDQIDAVKNSDQEDKEEDHSKSNKKELSPLEKQLQYKKLIVYSFQKIYFKLMQTENKEVNKMKRQHKKHQKFNNVAEMKEQMGNQRLIDQEEEVENLDENEILAALKSVDDMIEERMDNLLNGIKMLNYNALSISEGLETVHKKVMINLDKVEHNNGELKSNQKRLEEAAKYVSKPNCIMNVIIALLLGLIGYLVVKLIWFQ